MTSPTPPSPASPPPRAKRHAAGTDPRKRDQILAGAWEEFRAHGFDATTMNGICRAAAVSKGTLYVYFQGKEDLFVALVEQQRDRLTGQLGFALSGPGDVASRLTAYAVTLVQVLTSDEMLRAQRIVVAVAERMPDLAQRFYDAGGRHVLGRLGRWLAEATAAGVLAIPDPPRAAQQFSELAMAGVWRQRLFGVLREPPEQSVIDALAADAVRVFLAAYAGAAPPDSWEGAPGF